MRNRFLISGWYGFGNLGDEAILRAIVDGLKSRFPECQVSCLSYKPKFTRVYHSIEAAWQPPSSVRGWVGGLLRLRIFGTILFFLRCDVLLIGGGGFLSDWQSDAPWVWLRQAMFGKLLGKKVVLYGIGAGPFKTAKGKKITSSLINRYVDLITVRDQKSKDELIDAGVNRVKIELTADPAVSISCGSSATKTLPKRIGFSIAPIFHKPQYWPGKIHKYNSYVSELAKTVEILHAKGYEVVFIPMQAPDDVMVCKDICELTRAPVEILPPQGNISLDIARLNEVDVLVAMRLHSAILACGLGIPIAGLVYHHKVDEFLKAMSLRDYASDLGDGSNWRDSDITADEIVAKLVKVIDNYVPIKAEMVNCFNKMQKDEKMNLDALERLLMHGKVSASER